MTSLNYCKSTIIQIILLVLVNSINGSHFSNPVQTDRLYRKVYKNLNLVLADDDIQVDTVTECSIFCLNNNCHGFAFCKSSTPNCFLFSHGNSSAASNISDPSTCSFYVASKTASNKKTIITSTTTISVSGGKQDTAGSSTKSTTQSDSTTEKTTRSTTTPECINFTGGGCMCPNGATNDDCSQFIEDCSDYTGKELIHIKPTGWQGDAFLVRCMYRKIIIHMRKNIPSCHSMSFNLSWSNYSEGFGDVENGCFWLGNDKIAGITNSNTYKMILGTTISSSLTLVIAYHNFRMESAVNNYRLNYSDVHDYVEDGNGLDGPGTDKDVNGEEFYTYDRDRNGCAAASGGGWWYADGCAYGNLNNNSWPYWPIKSQLSVLESSALGLGRD